jgi:uncharacterized Zn-finger protein
MAEPVEIIQVDTTHVSCDGGGGALGHPKVYLQIKESLGQLDCPYCGRRYVLKQGAKAGAGH